LQRPPGAAAINKLMAVVTFRRFWAKIAQLMPKIAEKSPMRRLVVWVVLDLK
jgi:hypothetical protein